MDIAELGKIAGIAGIGAGVLLFLFKDIIAKSVLSKMPAETSYRFLRMAMILVWSFAVLALILWWLGSVPIAIGNGNTQVQVTK